MHIYVYMYLCIYMWHTIFIKIQLHLMIFVQSSPLNTLPRNRFHHETHLAVGSLLITCYSDSDYYCYTINCGLMTL